MPGAIDFNPLGGGGGAGSTATFVTIADETATLTNSQQFGDLLDNGTLAARPAAGTKGRYYLVASGASIGNLYYDNGASWVLVYDAAALSDHLADTADAHDASAISIVDTGGFYTGTDVEAALGEIPELVRDTIGTALTGSGNINVTPDDAGNTITISATAGGVGGLVTLGHSYTQTGGNGGGNADQFTNFTHRLAGTVGIAAEEVYAWGRSGGSWGTSSDSTDGDVQAVSAIMFKHVYPSHMYASSTAPRLTSKAWPAMWVFCAGLNDPIRAATLPSTALQAGIENGARAAVSRALAKAIWLSNDSTGAITYSAGGFDDTTSSPRPAATSGVATSDYNSGPSFRISTQNNDTVTFTVPSDFTGGTVVFAFHGCPRVGTSLSSSVDGSTTTIPVSDVLGYYAQIKNNDVIQIDSEQMLVTGGAGTTSLTVTRAYNGTIGASHTSGSANVYLPTTTARVNWSGTATGATGTTYLAGTGYSNAAFRTGCHVVKRFALTAADAGATIIATVAGIPSTSNEYVAFDSVWIEDTEPSVVLLVNQPYFSFASTAGAFTSTTGATVNTALDTIAAEFPSSVQVVDLATPFANLFGATVQTATSTGTTIHITPVSAASNVIAKGSVLRCENEEMLVTSAITKTSDTDWSFTVTRNYTGTGSGTGSAASTGNTNHAIGKGIYVCDPWTTDRIHPSDYGHALIAKYCLDELATIQVTTAKAASGAGLVLRRDQRLRDAYYRTMLYYSSATRTTVALTQDTAYAFPVLMPEAFVLEELGCEVTTLSASSNVRLGLYADGPGRPGTLIADFGQVSTASTGSKTVTPFLPCKPGIYWAVLVPQSAGSATYRAVSSANTVPPVWYAWQHHSSAPSGATSVVCPVGYSCTGVTGALASTFSTTGEAYISSSSMPVMWMKIGIPLRD